MRSSSRRSSSWKLSTFTVPPVGRSSPPSMFSKVDLPEPEVPMMATNCPASTDRETSSRAFTRLAP